MGFTSEQTAKLNFRHGEAVRGKMTREYEAYRNAKKRCRNCHEPYFKDYGGRGIQFRFKCFADFLKAVGRKPSRKHVLDRISNNGHYEAGNVRWATRSESSKNRRMTKKLKRAMLANFRKAHKRRWATLYSHL